VTIQLVPFDLSFKDRDNVSRDSGKSLSGGTTRARPRVVAKFGQIARYCTVLTGFMTNELAGAVIVKIVLMSANAKIISLEITRSGPSQAKIGTLLVSLRTTEARMKIVGLDCATKAASQ
jgi:hypothetical protein